MQERLSVIWMYDEGTCIRVVPLRFFIGIQNPFHRQLISTLFRYPKNYITLFRLYHFIGYHRHCETTNNCISFNITILGGFSEGPKVGILMVNSLTQTSGFNKKNSSYLAD